MVRVVDKKKLNKEDTKRFAHFVCCAEDTDKSNATIYIDFPIRKNTLPSFCHELIHVMQYICAHRYISFVDEKEHIAYMYNYILNEVMGLEYYNG